MAGDFCPNLEVKINPSNAMKKNWEKVIKFPELGTSLKKEKNISIKPLLTLFYQHMQGLSQDFN